ncbi:HDIG domain-containing metalloprotein [Ruminiclostridium cellulolyticum]|uniref:Metal dependent phosphohydrolase n=1 Tax=Ruminiclostridium cellulolyticum (strain ATCC 35319 / DSM 5812 / JCM 6584 / H10) TaxID=394503 RepID=B8I4T9_RUMCH|nr:HDIG domain-containing metalloprotein [Ruminiclostridium cellulolyticum]ACL76593.1 metal dependent phosphohydrolase [Ruminiclostridium cellulolyticum H10]
MNRDEAYEELKVRLYDKELLRHSLAVEAVMKEFAKYYDADIEMWGLAGLLHDIDSEKAAGDSQKHSLLAAQILENFDIDESIIYCIRAQNDYQKIPRKRKMDKVLYAANHLTKLITYCADRLPDKNISDVTAQTVIENITKSDVQGINFEHIKHYKELNITLLEFVEITLNAMQKAFDNLRI